MEQSLLSKRFITVEKSADSELSHKLPGLTVKFSFAETFLGEVLVVSTPQGVCYIAFVVGDRGVAESGAMSKFLEVFFEIGTGEHQHRTLAALSVNEENTEAVPLYLRGTDLRLRVWNGLLKIPFSETATYGEIVATLQNLRAYQAVGTAIGNNPAAVLIPRHRVLRIGGTLGGHHWELKHKV